MKGQIRLITLILLGAYGFLGAQSIANYTVTRSTGITYSSIASTGSAFGSWRNTATFSQDDNRSDFTDIGFDFWYDGIRYTQLSVSTNGFIDFSSSTSDGTGSGAYGYSNAAFTGNGSGTWCSIAPFYDDMTAQGGTDALGNSIKYELSGSAPNRVLTIEWINMAVYANTSPDLNFQVKLYETTGVIEFVYGTMTQGTNTFSYSCGINAPTLSNTPSTAQLKMQRTANTTTFNNTQTNNLSTLPTSNSKITLTPPVPANHSGSLSFTSVTQTSMTLNWTNWATNEVGYVIYYSTDNVNFIYNTQVAANSTSATISSLSPGTTYYWRVYAVTEGCLSDYVSGSQATTAAGNKISVATGSWNTAGTWNPSGVPTATDNVIITSNHTVTVNATATCNSLTVGQGSAAVLQIGNSTTSRSLTVNGDLSVAANATIEPNISFAATHSVTIGGNIVNNGTLNFSQGTSLCNTTIINTGDVTISGTGTTTTFNNLVVTLGLLGNTLDITTPTFSAANNFLTLNTGTFKLSTSGASTITPFTGAATIGSANSIWLNSALSTINFGASVTLLGNINVSNGTMNIGDAANEDLISNGGLFTIDGGAVNIAGKYYTTNINNTAIFSINGGVLTVPYVSSTNTTTAPFNINGVGSEFNMSGGTIIIPREGGTGAQDLGYVNTGASTGIVSGGVLQIGSPSSPASQIIQINSAYPIGSVMLNSANVTGKLLTNDLEVINDVDLESGTLDANNLNMIVGGDWTNNGGTYTTGTGTVTFDGSVDQAINGSAASQTFYNVSVATTGGAVLSSGGSTSTITTNNLTLTSGSFTAPATLNVNNTSTAAVTLTTGTLTAGNTINVAGNWTNNGGTFTPGSGTVNFTGTAAQAINGTATSQTFNNINIAKTAGTTLSTGGSTTSLTTNNLTLTTGNFTAPATLNVTGSSSASITLSAGTFTAGTNINLYGSWTNNGATFTPGTGTVTFSGSSSQSIFKSGGETFYNLSFSNGGTKTLASNVVTSANLTINSGATFDVSTSNYLVTVKGNFSNSGTMNTQLGNVFLNGTAAQTIGGTTTTNFYDLTLNNNAGASLLNDENIVGSLSLNNGTFNVNSKVLTLISTATGTGRIAQITGTGDISGNITQQRFAPGGYTGWAYLGSPISSAITMTQWDDDIYISCPTCPDGSAGGFISIYEYDETISGTYDNWQAYTAMSTINDPITYGKGYWVYLGDGATNTNDITIDVTGTPGKFNYSIPLTYTSFGSAPDDGWNLISNPYPSPISWASLKGTTANIDNAIYVYNADLNGGTGAHATYVNGISSPAVGSGGIDDNIPTGQGFYVHSTGATSLSATESIKVSGNPTFLRTMNANGQNQTANAFSGSLMRLYLDGLSYHDEAVLYIENGTSTDFDAGFDAYKIAGGDPLSPTISFEYASKDLQVNSIAPISSNISIPLKALTGHNGNYTISTEGVSSFPDGTCITLYDKFTGTTTDLRTTNYTFNLRDTTSIARFTLNITLNPLSITSTVNQPDCASPNAGQIIAQGTNAGPWNYKWFDANGNAIKTSNNITGPDTLTNVGEGDYTVEVQTVGTCDNNTTTFTIINPVVSPLPVQSFITDAQCQIAGSAMIVAQGTNSGPWDYVWKDNNGNVIKSDLNVAGPDSIMGIDAGDYTLEINTTGQCDKSINNLSVGTQSETPLQITSSQVDPDCSGLNTGQITAQGTNAGPWDYVWKDNSGNIIDQSSNSPGASTISGLVAGTYSLEINTSGGCDWNTITFDLNSPVTDPMSVNEQLINPTCSQPNNGEIIVSGQNSGPWAFVWKDGTGTIIRNLTSSFGADTLSNLTEGVFTLEINTVGACDYNTFAYIIKSANPNPLQIVSTVVQPSCTGSSGGQIIAAGESGGPWNYVWMDVNGNVIRTTADTTASDSLNDLMPGTYFLQMNSVGEECDYNTITLQIDPLIYPTAAFTSVDTVYLVQGGVAVFTNTSSNAQGSVWDFGDGTGTSTAMSPSYTYTQVGTYIVQLNVLSSSNCDDVFTKQIVVLNSATSIAALNTNEAIIVKTLSAGHFVVSGFKVKGKLKLMDELGRTVKIQEVNDSWSLVDLAPYQDGIYYLKFNGNDGSSIVLKLANTH